jgi:hypothetical protein
MVATRVSVGTALTHHGSAVAVRCSSVPRRMRTPLASSCDNRSSAVNVAADQAVTRSNG